MFEDSFYPIADYAEYKEVVIAFVKHSYDVEWDERMNSVKYILTDAELQDFYRIRDETFSIKLEKLDQEKRVTRKLMEKGTSFEYITDLLGIDMETLEFHISQIKLEDRLKAKHCL